MNIGQIEKLLKENEDLSGSCECELNHLDDEALFLLARIKELEGALRIYAELDDWGYDHGPNSKCDYGHAAREALKVKP